MNKTRTPKSIDAFPKDFHDGTFTDVTIKKSGVDVLRYQIHKMVTEAIDTRVKNYGKDIPMEDSFYISFLINPYPDLKSNSKEIYAEGILDSISEAKAIPHVTGVYSSFEWAVIYEELKGLDFQCGIISKDDDNLFTHLWIRLDRLYDALICDSDESEEEDVCDGCGDCDCNGNDCKRV